MPSVTQDIYGLAQERALDTYQDIVEEGHDLVWKSKLYWSVDSVRALAGGYLQAE